MPEQTDPQKELAEKRKVAKTGMREVRKSIERWKNKIQPVPGDEVIGNALSTLAQCDTLLELGGR